MGTGSRPWYHGGGAALGNAPESMTLTVGEQDLKRTSCPSLLEELAWRV